MFYIVMVAISKYGEKSSDVWGVSSNFNTAMRYLRDAQENYLDYNFPVTIVIDKWKGDKFIATFDGANWKKAF